MYRLGIIWHLILNFSDSFFCLQKKLVQTQAVFLSLKCVSIERPCRLPARMAMSWNRLGADGVSRVSIVAHGWVDNWYIVRHATVHLGSFSMDSSNNIL